MSILNRIKRFLASWILALPSPINPFDHEKLPSAFIGDNAGDPRFKEFSKKLAEIGAKKKNYWWGFGGSQEIACTKFKIGEQELTIQDETYMGIHVFGNRELLLKLVSEEEILPPDNRPGLP